MSGEALQVLLIEDNPGDIRLLEESLHATDVEHSVKMDHCSSLSSSLEHLKKKPADIILLDLGLPDGQGLQTLHDFHQAVPQLPVIVLTGSKDESLALKSLHEGAQDYLIKGEFNGDMLLRSVRYAMERFQLFQKLREEQERFTLAAVGSNDGLWEWNLAANRMYLSLRWKLIVGYNDSEIGEDADEWFKRIHPEDRPRVMSEISRHLARETPHFANEHRLQHKDGSYRWVFSRGLAVHDVSGKVVRMGGSFTDITARKSLEEQLVRQAHYDPLTNLPNRLLFMENLERSFARARRNPNYLFAVFFLDMDRFKFINDNLGHVAGDHLLSEFGSRLRSCVRPNDLVARMGGDEFTVLLDDLKSPDEATLIADRILGDLKSPFRVGGNETLGSVSIGIAFSNCGASSVEEILNASDTALHRAKTMGKARYEVFDQIMRFDSINTLKLERDFQQALQNGEFFIHYQPVVSLEKDRIVGCEVLLRWQHPRHGLIPPARFIPWAEELGLMGTMDEMTLHAACAQNKLWHSGGHSDLFISINAVAQQIRTSSILDVIQKVLEKTGLESRYLHVEIPGWMMIKEKLVVLPILNDLKRMGIQATLDHYGLGFATLRDMREFPVENLKLDRDFIDSMGRDRLDASLADVLITAAHNLGIRVTAVGVESKDELDLLRKYGCDYAQGDFLGPPLPADKFSEWLAAGGKIREIA